MPVPTLQRPPGNPLIMGIVNVTPDSFSDGGEYFQAEAAADHAIQLLDEGADIVDIGGESTRPPGKDYGAGSALISADEECSRVLPVIRAVLTRRPQAVISIDTVKPEVADAALSAGALILNDVSGGQYDEQVWNVAATHRAPYIVMHGHDPHNRKPVQEIVSNDVVAEVFQFLEEQLRKIRQAGVQSIIADPGIGFAKGADDSIALLSQLAHFAQLNVPLLVGASRKSFIGRELGGVPPQDRLFGTLGAHAAAALNGASIVRVHDVRAAYEFFQLFSRLLLGRVEH